MSSARDSIAEAEDYDLPRSYTLPCTSGLRRKQQPQRARRTASTRSRHGGRDDPIIKKVSSKVPAFLVQSSYRREPKTKV